MSRQSPQRRPAIRRAAVAGLAAAITMGTLHAQPGGTLPPAPAARDAAPFDLTGYWVAVVTEDWRWRMVTAPKGDAAGVPLNAEGRRVAAAWDPGLDAATGDRCRAYGAAGLMRLPLRVRITWQDDDTLRLDTDAGQQTRLFQFRDPPPAAGDRSLQGRSVARWQKQPQRRGARGAPERRSFEGGSLVVRTTEMRSGYLRKNGIPYSADAALTEYFNRHSGPADLEWFTVTTIVEDPTYLSQPFVTSSTFRREADGSQWRPVPCGAP